MNVPTVAAPTLGAPILGAPTLVAVAHGTAEPLGTATVRDLRARIARERPGLDVVLCHVEHTEPSVTQALLATSARHLVVVPLLLFAATHSKGDVPAAITRVRAERPEVRIDYASPLGPHSLLVSALADRLAEAGADDTHAVVLAAAGASDPDANAEVVATARRLWEWRSAGAGRTAETPPVEAGFASATRPDVGASVARLRRLGHERVAVATAFLAPGHFARLSKDAALGVDPSCLVSDPLGDHADIARLALLRYDEALAGEARGNCDTCMFRAPWPGRERRVSEAQRLHEHPSDS